ncbi:NYN domain-containing protein [Thalassotalea sp. LPB0316]|uniref:LabA-like NYN domain-containing protein n=1 Tax=Thalassotalea sp. LPB0316 TaxID=2769490 RepID=UPI0018663C36|nr:NYN domain-containing protein [Thalassotalea sp. LPB0316]QOL26248.1 NYN domain-containing protein [Thalassotalea sp. LPB0316]
MKANTAIFVDVQNIYYTTRQAFGRSFNYRQFWQDVAHTHDISLANAYAIAHQDDQQHKFQKALSHIGFTVKTKPYIQRKDGSAKGDWDVGITLDVFEHASEVEEVILLSGDGDFDLLLKRIKEKFKVKTTVYGVEGLTAASLINAADNFIAIDQRLLQ